MSVKYNSITNPKDWLEIVAKQMEASVVNNEMQLPKHIGQGFFKQYYPFEWLTVSYLKFKVYKPLELIRTGVSDKPLVPIVFHLFESQQFINNTHYQVGKHTPNGIFMPSTEINSKLVLSANKWITNFTLTFDKEWVVNEFLEKDSYLYELLTTEKSFYIFESFTIELLALINEMNQELSTNKMRKLHFHSLLIQILDKFFVKVNERKHYESKSKIHHKDIDKLFKVRQTLLDNIRSLPKISLLAEEAGMSPSKLHKSFKQIFGKNISQYALSYKMEEARRILITRKYTISEVGYMVGYNNLSHFSESFKKYFGVNPSIFLNSLKSK